MRVKITKFFWDCDLPSTSSRPCPPASSLPQFYLEEIKFVCQCLTLLGFNTICNIFPIIDQGRFCFFGIGPDLLMNGLEDRIIFLICAAWILFNFDLTKKQRFSVYSFIENASYIPSMEKFGLDIEK